MNADVTTQSIKEKVGLRVVPAIFILAGFAFLAGAAYVLVSNISVTQTTTSKPARLPTTIPSNCDPALVGAVPDTPNETVRKTLADEQIGLNPDCAKKFAPGELIVKFKTDQAIDNIQYFLRSPSGTLTRASNPLVTLSSQKKLQKIDRVFSKIVTTNALKQKFSQRAARAPKNVIPPNLSRIYKLSFPIETDIPALAAEYQKLSDVEYAEPNNQYTLNVEKVLDPVPTDEVQDILPIYANDPYYSSSGSWGQPYRDMWGMRRLFSNGWLGLPVENTNVIVAISDTGIDYNHSDIQGQIWTNLGEISGNWLDDDQNGHVDDIRGWDFAHSDNDPMDRHGHGTHVAGIVGAKSNNAYGVASVHWNAKLMPVKGFIDGTDAAYESELAATIDYAVDNGADVLNMSWGGYTPSQLIADALAYAYSAGVISVAAAGNDHYDVIDSVPASYPHVISVGAWNGTVQPEQAADFSNFGSSLDLTAPGQDILSLRAADTDMYGNGIHVVGGSFYRSDGTSMAAPHVAGVASMMLASAPTMSSDLFESLVPSIVEDVLAPGRDRQSGFGLIDPFRAALLVQNIKVNNLPELFAHNVEVRLGTNGNLTFRAQIVNTGTVNAPSARYRIYNGTSQTGIMLTEGVINLPPGAKYDLNYSFAAMAAPGVITLLLDPDNAYTEYSEINNLFELRPDIEIMPFVHGNPFFDWGGTSAHLGGDNRETVNVDIVFANYGTRPVHNVPYRVRVGGPSGPIIANGVFNGSVDIGDQATIAVTAPITFPTWELTVQLDPANVIVEMYDNNNALDSIPVQLGFYGGWKGGFAEPAHSVPGQTSYNPTTGPALSDLDGDGDLDYVYAASMSPASGQSAPYFLWAIDKTGVALPGWPRQLNGMVLAELAVEDLNGDGRKEVVAITNDLDNAYSYISVFSFDGLPFPGGWPRQVGRYRTFAAPVIGDLDPAYPGLEIVAAVLSSSSSFNSGQVFAWHHDGTPVPGAWPVSTGNYIKSTPVLADIDPVVPGLEIILNSTMVQTDPNYGDFVYGQLSKTFAWHKDGSLVPHWPKIVSCIAPRKCVLAGSPAVGDVNGDGRLDVVTNVSSGDFLIDATDENWTNVYDGNTGSQLPGWPKNYENLNLFSPVLADVSGDGKLDIIVYEWGTLHVYNHLGQTVSGWPQSAPSSIGFMGQMVGARPDYDRLIVSDLNGDHSLEIILAAEYSPWEVFHADGSLMSGTPLNIRQIYYNYAGAVADIDNNGTLELAGSWFHIWTMPWDSTESRTPWPTYQQNNHRTGAYPVYQAPPSGGSHVNPCVETRTCKPQELELPY